MKIPFGYKMVDGKLVIDDQQAAIVRVMYDLQLLKLTEDGITVQINSDDVVQVLNEFNIAPEKNELENIKPKMLERCKDILRDKIIVLKEQQLKQKDSFKGAFE